VGWEPEDFTALPRTPLLNLVALVLRSPSFKLRELRHVNADEALAMLHYDPSRTYAEHDHRSAAELLDSLGFSDRGRAMLFEVFAHSFFNVEQRYSAAEFLAMCHFYFTGNPEGLGMDAPTEDYRTALWEPLTRLLEKHGATVTTGSRAVSLRPDGARGWAVDVEGEPARHARHLVVATDVPATRDLVAASPELVANAPGLARRIAGLPGGEPYVVARLFCEGDVDPSRSVFTGVTRERVLDSVTLFHRLEGGSARWARERGGSVVELHSYACTAPDVDTATARMRAELAALWPETADAQVVHLQQRMEATAPTFPPGGAGSRPLPCGEARGIRVAGDYVETPFLTGLMERASASGVLAANDVLGEVGAGPEPIRAVPQRGLLAGLVRTRPPR
jgi:isorenieratene synthase